MEVKGRMSRLSSDARAAEAGLKTWATHERARQEQKYRQQMAAALQLIQIVRVWEQPTADGYQGVFLDVLNATDTPVVELLVSIHYWSGQQLVGTDDSCRVAATIPAGQTGRVGCYKQQVAGATAVQPQITDVRWGER